MTGGGVAPAVDAFRRGRPTFLLYGSVAAFAYGLYALGPYLTLLAAELDLSYAALSLHSTAWAAGTVLVGLVYGRASAALDRAVLFRIGVAGSVVGAAVLALGRATPVTLAGAALGGAFGALVQTSAFAALADLHGPLRDRALVEANIGASAAAVLAPVALGGLAVTAVGWRGAMWLPVVALLALVVVFRDVRLPGTGAGSTPGSTPGSTRAGGLSARCWALCAVTGLVVGVEFAVVYYGGQLLREGAGLDAVAAATWMSLFFVAQLVGRVVGSRIAGRPGLLPPLIAAAIGGLALLRLGTAPATALTGLALTGLAVANLFPLALSAAVAASGGRTDLAAARAQLLVGAATTFGPLLLGLLADRVGVRPAFSVALVMAGAALAVVLALRERTAARG
ncbi:MFS transporter [Actinosynnema pretiosum]|uniref:MFS transporter n=1 Tax=Actinosynnema pretiosum TaxID=42197 RepID=UPI0015A5F57F|nr:MFS transporter [Actinosynnema pretiosum]